MTILFRRIKPNQRFHINRYYIAQLLKIPLSTIVKIERWAYVIFVHRCDKGGQFVSYRELARWLIKIARMIQTSPTLQDLKQLGLWIKQESVKFEDKYSPNVLQYWRQLWAKRRDELISLSESSETG